VDSLEAWLALTKEEPIDTGFPICDPHHHLWDYRVEPIPPYALHIPRYLIDELLQDTGGGHNISQTVFVECTAMLRKNGPQEMQPVGETEFVQGIACLQKYGLSFDALVYHHQLLELVDLARASPEIPIILNHVAVPLGVGPYANKRKEVFQEWKNGIAALVECANVVVKLGGLGMPHVGFGWHERAIPPGSAELAESMAPYYLWCIK